MNPKKLLLFARNIKTAYRLYFDWLEQARINEAVDAKIRELGFLTPGDVGIYGSPSRDVGTAIKLAARWGIEQFAVGTSYGQCRANLPKNMWQHPIDPDKESGDFGSLFANRPHDEIDNIHGFGSTVNEAVCRCLINCKTAGVL